MALDPISLVEQRLIARVDIVKRAGDTLTAQCPAHDDSNPSLSVSLGTKGRDVVMHCHAGCRPDDILAALDLTWTDFGPERRDDTTATYVYHDATGRPSYRVVRRAGKKFHQEAFAGDGWIKGIAGIDRILYRLPAVLAAIEAGDTIYVAEGEKDVDTLTRHGVVATCNSGGAGSFLAEHGRLLAKAARVIVIADRDKPGLDHAADVVAKIGGDIEVVLAKVGKDATDHLSAGWTIDDFVPLGWPEPVPLDDLAIPPPWPAGVLPAWMQAQAEGVADELQGPIDLPAILALVALSLIAAKKAVVAIRGAWREPLNIYTIVAMPPSAGKSPAVRMMLGPLSDWEQAEAERLAPIIERARQVRRMIETCLKKSEAKGDTAEALHQLDQLHDNPIPVAPRLWTDDATPEALVQRLGEHDGRLGVVSTEGGVFKMMAGRYTEGSSNLDPYLQGWSGDSIFVDRVGRESFSVHHPAITFGLTVQPKVLNDVGHDEENQGRGLIARFMYSVPRTMIGSRNLVDGATLDPDVDATYRQRLLDLVQRLGTITTPGVITMSDEARSAFLHWRQSLEVRRGPGGDLAHMDGWTTKLESTTARLAGLLHIADGGDTDGEISVGVMARALAAAGYWIDHARIVHDQWSKSSDVDDASAIVKWAVGARLDEFTARDIYGAMRRRFERVDDLVEPLTLLAERGWIRSSDPNGALVAPRRGKESPVLTLTPHARHAPHARTQPVDNPPHARHARSPKASELTPSFLFSELHEGGRTCAHGAHVEIDPTAGLPPDEAF